MPIDYKDYHPNWLKKIRPDILKRSKNKCEFCGIENHLLGYRDKKTKNFIELENSIENDIFLQENNIKLTKIVLTIAHLDHDKSNNDYSNLKALCQACHLNYDMDRHVFNRKHNPHKKAGQQAFFDIKKLVLGDG